MIVCWIKLSNLTREELYIYHFLILNISSDGGTPDFVNNKISDIIIFFN